MKKLSVILGAIAMTVVMGCNSDANVKTSASGLRYKLFEANNNAKAQHGDIIKFHFEQRLRFAKNNKDTVLTSNFNSAPFYAKVDSTISRYDPGELFDLLGIGDSLVTYLSIDTLIKNGNNMPDFIGKEDELLITFKVLDIFKDDSVARADQMAEMEKEQARLMAENERLQKAAEDLIEPKTKEIEEYLSQNSITTQKTPSGVFVLVSQEGNGPAVEDGKTISVRYTGKLFPSGDVFESNATDDSRPAFTFVIGQGRVIKGWEEGLKLFKKGGKGTLFIPFNLAYGAQPGPGGNPHENLIFDVEIVDVK